MIFFIHPFLKFSKYKQVFPRWGKKFGKAIDLNAGKFYNWFRKISPKTFINKGNISYFKKQIKVFVDIVFFNVNLTLYGKDLENELNAR